MIKKLSTAIYPLLYIILFSLFFTYKLFNGETIFYGEEQGFLNYDYVNYRHSSIWDWTHNFGSVFSAGFFNVFTAGLFWRVLHDFNVSFLDTQRYFYFVIVFFTMLFTYLATVTLNKSKLTALLIATLIITTYHYFAILVTTPKITHFLIVPMSLYFWLKFNETLKWRYLLGNTIGLLLTLGIAINPPQLIGAYAFIVIYILLFSFNKNRLWTMGLFLFPYVLNFFFVFISNYFSILNAGSLIQFNQFQIAWSATGSRIYEILRLFGGWWDYAGHQDISYNHLATYYHNHIGIIISYIPFFATLFLLYKSAHIQLKVRVLALLLISIFCIKGSGVPFNFIFNSLFEIEFFKIFREPWAKFMPNFIYALYFSIACLLATVSLREKRIVHTLLLFVLVFQLIPVFQGNILDHRNKDWKLSDIVIPEYWTNLSKWSEENIATKRVLTLPIAISKDAPLIQDWKPYPYWGNPEEFLLYANIINNRGANDEEEIIMNNYLEYISPNILSISSVDYLLDKRDATTSASTVLTLPSLLPAVDPEKKLSFGPLDLYPIKESLKTEKIRNVNKLYSTFKPCNLSVFNHEIDFRRAAVVKTNRNVEDIALDEKGVMFERMSDTAYKVTLNQQTQKDIGLLFADTYNTGWKIYESLDLSAKPILDESSHIPANCFSNFWLIPKDFARKNPTIYIQYEPQKQFELLKIGAAAVTLAYLFVCQLVLRRKP